MTRTKRLAIGFLAGLLAVSLVEVEPASAAASGLLLTDSFLFKDGNIAVDPVAGPPGTALVGTATGAENPDPNVPPPPLDPVVAVPTGTRGVYSFSFQANPGTTFTLKDKPTGAWASSFFPLTITESAILANVAVSGNYDACANRLDAWLSGTYTARAEAALLILPGGNSPQDFTGLPISAQVSTANPGSVVSTSTNVSAVGTATLGGITEATPVPGLLDPGYVAAKVRSQAKDYLNAGLPRSGTAASLHFAIGWASQLTCPPPPAATGTAAKTGVAGVRCRRVRRGRRTRLVCKRVRRKARRVRRVRRRSRRRR